MTLTWYGTAGLILRDGGFSIAFDPFCSLPVGEIKSPPARLRNEDEYKSVSDVFVTHGHFDHIYHIPRLYESVSVTVHCTSAPCKTLLKHGLERSKIDVIAPASVINAGPFRVTAYQGRHCKFDLPLIYTTVTRKGFFGNINHLLRLLWLNITYREKGEILFYELECRGKRIQIIGSMNLDAATEYPTNADLLILPLQGRSDQNVYALGLVKRLMPKNIILDHIDNTFPPMTDDVDVSGFTENVSKSFDIPCLGIAKGEEIEINL